jgi:hypothetical protein
MAEPAKAKSGRLGARVAISITDSEPSNQDVQCYEGDIIQFTATDQPYVLAFDNFPLGIALAVNEPQSFPVVKENFTAHYGVSVDNGVAARIMTAPYRIQGGTGDDDGSK